MAMMTDRFEPKRVSCRTRIGPLEAEVMEIVWSSGECSVRQVMRQLPRPAAYTTVMTTMARLFEKNLLQRRGLDRAFLYSPRLSAQEFEVLSARESVDRFLASPGVSRELLLRSLLDAIANDVDLVEHVVNTLQEKCAT